MTGLHPDPNAQQKKHAASEWNQSYPGWPRERSGSNGQTKGQTKENHSEQDLPRIGAHRRREIEYFGFLVGRIWHDRKAGRRLRNQTGGLGLGADGPRRHENRRLALPALDPLTIQRFIARVDFMT